MVMAWRRVQVRTIPNADTDYERFSEEVVSYIKTNYEDTGKRTFFDVTESDDGLILTYTSVFKDEASKNEMLSDSIISAESTRRSTINAANGITSEVTVDEEA